MGCKFAVHLQRAAEVFLIEKNSFVVEAIRQQGGIVYITGDEEKVLPVAGVGFSPPREGRIDLALILVKGYDTLVAISAVGDSLSPEGAALSLQDGLGNREAIARVVDDHRALQGVTLEASRMLRPGRVLDTGRGATYLGPDPSDPARTEAICALFNEVGLKTYVARNLEGLVWDKLILSVGVNAFAVLFRVPHGPLESVPELRTLTHVAMDEAYKIARRKGIDVNSNYAERYQQLMADTAQHISTSLADYLSGRATEVDAINGQIVMEGGRLGIDTRINQLITDLVKAAENTRDVQLRLKEEVNV